LSCAAFCSPLYRPPSTPSPLAASTPLLLTLRWLLGLGVWCVCVHAHAFDSCVYVGAQVVEGESQSKVAGQLRPDLRMVVGVKGALIHALAWCPWEQASGGDGALGVVAVASSNGQVLVLRVPVPPPCGTLDKRCPPSALPSAAPHTSRFHCARLRRLFSSVEARVCGCGADEGGSHRVEAQELMRVEVHSGYCSCVDWSPSNCPPSQDAQLDAHHESFPPVCGHVAAGCTNGHTLLVPVRLGGGVGLTGSGPTSDEAKHDRAAEDQDGLVILGAADNCQVTCVCWASSSVVVTGCHSCSIPSVACASATMHIQTYGDSKPQTHRKHTANTPALCQPTLPNYTAKPMATCFLVFGMHGMQATTRNVCSALPLLQPTPTPSSTDIDSKTCNT